MERKSLIVIGLNPGKRRVRKGSTLPRLFEWMTNLNVHFFSFGNLSMDKEWDFKYNSIDHNFVLQQVDKCDIILALGGMVERYLIRMGVPKDRIFKLPHPSPRNRLLNDPSYIVNVLKDCQEFINES